MAIHLDHGLQQNGPSGAGMHSSRAGIHSWPARYESQRKWTRDNNKIGDGRERRGRLKKRRSKKKCISKCGITIFRACVPIQKIPAFSDVLAFFKLEIPSGGQSNLRLRDVEKQPLAKIKHA
jgi:hypothetical protein